MSSLFNNTSTTNTSGNTNTVGTSNATSSSSTNPTFSPQMQELMDQLAQYSSSSMTNPMALFAPVQQAGLQAINESYASAPKTVAQQMASRGYGSSGSAGDAMYQANLARSGAVSGLQGTLSTDAINQMNAGASLGEQLLNTTKGSSTTGTASGTTYGSSSSTGTSTTTSSDLGSILGSLAQLLMNAPGSNSNPTGPASDMNSLPGSTNYTSLPGSTNYTAGGAPNFSEDSGGFDDGGDGDDGQGGQSEDAGGY